jgi:hypothetical protein
MLIVSEHLLQFWDAANGSKQKSGLSNKGVNLFQEDSTRRVRRK